MVIVVWTHGDGIVYYEHARPIDPDDVGIPDAFSDVVWFDETTEAWATWSEETGFGAGFAAGDPAR